MMEALDEYYLIFPTTNIEVWCWYLILQMQKLRPQRSEYSLWQPNKGEMIQTHVSLKL